MQRAGWRRRDRGGSRSFRLVGGPGGRHQRYRGRIAAPAARRRRLAGGFRAWAACGTDRVSVCRARFRILAGRVSSNADRRRAVRRVRIAPRIWMHQRPRRLRTRETLGALARGDRCLYGRGIAHCYRRTALAPMIPRAHTGFSAAGIPRSPSSWRARSPWASRDSGCVPSARSPCWGCPCGCALRDRSTVA